MNGGPTDEQLSRLGYGRFRDPARPESAPGRTYVTLASWQSLGRDAVRHDHIAAGPGSIRSDVTGSLSEVGVDADRESGVCGDALQQRDQPGLVGFVECGEQFGVVFVGGVFGLGEQIAGRFGEVKRVGAPVAGVASSLHQSPVFEVVEEPDHDVTVDSHRVGELLLGLPVASCQVGDQAEVPGVEAQWRQPFGKPRRGVQAELGEQAAGTLAQGRGRRGASRVRHHPAILPICQLQ